MKEEESCYSCFSIHKNNGARDSSGKKEPHSEKESEMSPISPNSSFHGDILCIHEVYI